MGSIKAQKMAMKVSENIKGERPSTFEKIALEVGYAPSSAKRSTQITRTKSYKTAMIAENAPLLEGLQEEINAIKNAMRLKDKTNEDYRVLAGSLAILVDKFQLLSGGATERQVFVLPSEVMQSNNLVQSEQKLLQENGSIEPLNEKKET
jgi:hypothetical protein